MRLFEPRRHNATTKHKEMYEPLSERENQLATIVVDIAFSLNRALGPGLLESVYESCFCYELDQRNIPYQTQQLVPIEYKGLVVEAALRLDILIDELLIVELKAQDNHHPVWEAQLLSYLKLTGNRIGYIVNFHVPLMKEGLKRLII